jgi:hypothetical protein
VVIEGNDHRLTSWYSSCGTIGSGIWVKYRLKMVATSCVVYVVFFQSKFLPYYGVEQQV